MSRSLYEVLGVAPDASLDTIKSAYRSQVRDCHRDRHPSDPTARARFEALTQGYKVLSDDKRRKKYDEAQTPSLSPGTASEGEALLTGLASWLGKAASEQVERRLGGSGLPRRLARELAKTAVEEASKTGKQKLVNSLVEKTGRKIGAMERTNRALQATTQQFMSMASRAEQALSDRQSPARILGQSLLGEIGSIGAHPLTLAGYEAIALGKPGEDPGFLERHAGWLCPLMLGVKANADDSCDM